MYEALTENDARIAKSDERQSARQAWLDKYGETGDERQIMRDEKHFCGGLHVARNIVDNALTVSSHGHKLTHRDVEAIRRRVAAGEKQKDLATEFGVTPSHVSRIVHNRAWPATVAQ